MLVRCRPDAKGYACFTQFSTLHAQEGVEETLATFELLVHAAAGAARRQPLYSEHISCGEPHAKLTIILDARKRSLDVGSILCPFRVRPATSC